MKMDQKCLISCTYIFYENYDDFECAGDEVLVESSPPASPAPDMAARLAQPAQGGAVPPAGGSSPPSVRELIVVPSLDTAQLPAHLHHALHQVSSTVVEVNGDSSGHSSPTADTQHTYITVSHQGEGGNGVNYHVQYAEPQEIYTQNHQNHLEPIRSYPVYGVGPAAAPDAADAAWPPDTDYTVYGVVVSGDEPPPESAPGPAPRMPPATVQWLLDHYETAEGVSLPRSTLYAHYLRHCGAHRLDPVNAASFGKLIRSVFVGLRTRRLGTRGNSKYHYYGIRAKAGPVDAEVDGKVDCEQEQPSSSPVGRSSPPRSPPPPAHRQWLGAVTVPDPPQLPTLPNTVPLTAREQLVEHHKAHGASFLEAVSALDTAGVERARRAFWRASDDEGGPGLTRRALRRLAGRPAVARWLYTAELQLHQRAVDLLLPDVLRPIPPHLTQAIRNFAKSVETALSSGAAGAPARAARAQGAAAGALAAALRRYTSLNHLAQAARAVLANTHQIQQMLADLNRVDFRVVREQAAWACACGSNSTAHRMEADFKATLGRGASLEQWASWLEGCVSRALAAHDRRPDFPARARRLLLDWSFYSSLVIRELTLRSAASFGSFHLIRLLYDEYVSYLIERRVAAHQGLPPIAVMHQHKEDEEDESKDLKGDEEDEAEWAWDEDDDEEEEDEEEDDQPDCKKVKHEE